jgi:glycosyltransferase involved in cell wall biosynthesis
VRIIFLTETFPYPLDSGGRIKTFNTLRILSERHQVACHAIARAPVASRDCDEVARMCGSVCIHRLGRGRTFEAAALGRSLIRRLPLSVVRHYDKRAASAIGRAARSGQFDLVYCDHLSMVEYGRTLQLPLLYDAHNAESVLVRRYARHARAGPIRWLSEREWRLLERYEQEAVRKAGLTIAATAVDAAALKRHVPTAAVRVVPVALDTFRIQPLKGLTAEPEILHLGGLHWPPTTDGLRYFVREILPGIRRAVPAARVSVVGRGASHASRVTRGPNIRLLDGVSDLESIWQRSRVLAVPLRSGSGVRLKILEAFARGVPVVSTSVGCEGLEVEHGRHLLVADDADEFARQTVSLLVDAELAAGLAREARAFVESNHAPGVVAPRLLDAVDLFAARLP